MKHNLEKWRQSYGPRYQDKKLVPLGDLWEGLKNRTAHWRTTKTLGGRAERLLAHLHAGKLDRHDEDMVNRILAFLQQMKSKM